MSKILERQFLANLLYNPSVLDKTTLKSDNFSDIAIRCVFSKLKQKHEDSKGYEFVNKDILPLIYENNIDIISSDYITTFKDFVNYIFSDYDRTSQFDWMFSENIIKEEHKKRQHKDLFEKAMCDSDEYSLDIVISNLELGLKNLEKDTPRDSSIIQGNSFMNIYNERSKEIEELKNTNKPTHYTPSHEAIKKYTRMKKGWFGSIISGAGGGKTIALCQEAVYHSDVYNEKCLYITDENSDEVVLTYMYCNYLGLKYHDIEDRVIDLDKYIDELSKEKKEELERVFKNIDVIEMAGIPSSEVRNLLKKAENNDNPYEWLGLDSFEEVNIDANVEEITRQNQNAIICERIAKDFSLILWVTAQLKTDFYQISIEKMMMTCNHGSKTLIKKNFISLLLWWEYGKSDDDDNKTLGFRGKINKCRSGGMGKVYEITQNYDYCRLNPSDNEIGNSSSVGF